LGDRHYWTLSPSERLLPGVVGHPGQHQGRQAGTQFPRLASYHTREGGVPLFQLPGIKQ